MVSTQWDENEEDCPFDDRGNESAIKGVSFVMHQWAIVEHILVCHALIGDSAAAKKFDLTRFCPPKRMGNREGCCPPNIWDITRILSP